MSPVRSGATPLRVVLSLLLAGVFAALTIAPAQAAAYRYWGFYQLTDGAWAFAQTGSDQTVPADGSVEGWRFAVGDEQSTRFPRAVLTFDELCAATPAAAGKKRVGLVVDYGRPADAEDGATPPEPTALCASVPTAATSTDVLAKAGELRTEKAVLEQLFFSLTQGQYASAPTGPGGPPPGPPGGIPAPTTTGGAR